MSAHRMRTNQLGLRENVLGCELHATALPYLACIAGIAEPPFANRALKHLESLARALEIRDADIESTAAALLGEKGDELEPFECPRALCRPLAIAGRILTRRPRLRSGGPNPVIAEHLLLMNHGVRAAYSGIEIGDGRCRRFRCRDFRLRAALGSNREEHPVPLAFDLPMLASSSVVPVQAHLERHPSSTRLVFDFRNRYPAESNTASDAVLQFGTGFRSFDGDPQVDRLGGPSLELGAIRGESSAHLLVNHLLARFPLNPTAMLKLSSLAGPKRFLVRASAQRAGYAPHDPRLPKTMPYLIVGSLDGSGVRAACFNAEGWVVPSNDWMPFVPFCCQPSSNEAGACEGSFDSLVELLLDLAQSPDDGPPSGGPSVASEAVGKKLPPRVRRQGKTEDPDAPPRKRRTAASQCAEAMQALRERLGRSGR